MVTFDSIGIRDGLRQAAAFGGDTEKVKVCYPLSDVAVTIVERMDRLNCSSNQESLDVLLLMVPR